MDFEDYKTDFTDSYLGASMGQFLAWTSMGKFGTLTPKGYKVLSEFSTEGQMLSFTLTHRYTAAIPANYRSGDDPETANFEVSCNSDAIITEITFKED